MKTNQNDPRHECHSRDQSNHRSYGEYNILDPSPDMDLNFLEDEDDETTGFLSPEYPEEDYGK